MSHAGSSSASRVSGTGGAAFVIGCQPPLPRYALGEQLHVGFVAGPAPHDVPELHERERVGDLRARCWACSSTSRTALPRSRSSRIASHDRLGRERREPEGGLVGDEDRRRVGQRGREAQHLLLAAGQEAGDLLAPLARGSGTARRPAGAAAASRSSTVRFSSTVRPGKMPRASGTSSTPSRARRNGARVRDVVAVEAARCRCVGVDEPGGDRAQRRLAGAVGAEQRDDRAALEREVDAVEHLDVAVAGDDAAGARTRASRRVGRARRRRSPRLRRVAAVSVRGARSCSGTTPPCAAASAVGDARVAAPCSRFLRSFCWPTSARMPSGSCASWMAPRPDRIGTK